MTRGEEPGCASGMQAFGRRASGRQASGLLRSNAGWRVLLPRPVWVYVWVLVGLWVCSWAFAGVEHVRGLPKPYTWPYFVSQQTAAKPHGDLFGDFGIFADLMPRFHTARFFEGHVLFNYPPASALVFRALVYPVTPRATPYFMVCCGLIGAGAVFAVRRLRAAGLGAGAAVGLVAVSLALSAPLSLEMLRLNLEMVVIALTATGVWMYWTRRYRAAAVLLGLAAAMKLFPIVLLGLLLPVKRYRAFALGLGVMAGATLAGLLGETPSVAMSLAGTMRGMTHFSEGALNKVDQWIGYDHGILSLLKVATQAMGGDAARLSARYMLGAAVFGLVVYFGRMYWMPRLNQVLGLMICAVLLPPAAGDYTLLHLYAPLLLLVLAMVRGELRGVAGRVLGTMMGMFGVVFGVEGFVVVRGIVYAGQVRCVVLLMLLGVVLWVPMGDGADAGLA